MLELQKLKVWRERARELRMLARQAKDLVAKQQLIELADTWDDMAARAEQRERSEEAALYRPLRVLGDN